MEIHIIQQMNKLRQCPLCRLPKFRCSPFPGNVPLEQMGMVAGSCCAKGETHGERLVLAMHYEEGVKASRKKRKEAKEQE